MTVVIEVLPEAREIWATADGTPLPDWDRLVEAGALHQTQKVAMLRLHRRPLVWLYPSDDFHRLAVVTESTTNRPGRMETFRRFWGLDRVTLLKDDAGTVYEVTLRDEWRSAENYLEAHPPVVPPAPFVSVDAHVDESRWRALVSAVDSPEPLTVLDVLEAPHE